MKLCIFVGEQKELITCCNPVEMVSMGVFNCDYGFLSTAHKHHLFNVAMESNNYIAPTNLFDNIEEDSPIGEILTVSNRKRFFDWYISFYYKLEGWKLSYPDMAVWHRQKIRELFNLYPRLDHKHHPQFKQSLLEIAWNWQQYPDILLP